MDPSEKASRLANAISEGINTLAHLQSLRAEAHRASPDELTAWGEAIDQTRDAIAEVLLEVEAGRAQTSAHLTGDLVRCLEDVRAHLAGIPPGAQLTEPLFARVEEAWSEFAKAMR